MPPRRRASGSPWRRRCVPPNKARTDDGARWIAAKPSPNAFAIEFHAWTAQILLARAGEIMDDSFPRNWMWSQACEMLARAERMHREMFRPLKPAAQLPVWEPPLDMLETEAEVLVLIALPGVNPDRVEAAIDGPDLVV